MSYFLATKELSQTRGHDTGERRRSNGWEEGEVERKEELRFEDLY